MAAADEQVEAIAAELRRGEVIGAYDRSRAALEAGLDSPRLRYLSVLALARSFATAKAARQYRALGLHRIDDVDCRSLWARIRKDLALAAPPHRRRHLLSRAAGAYAMVFRETGHYFPGINAATLWLLSGSDREARHAAASLLRFPEIEEPADYYAAATRAEAFTILGRWDDVAEALARARGLAGRDVGALSTTRRQLATLLGAIAPGGTIARDLLAGFRLPRVALLPDADVAQTDEARLAREGSAILAAEDVGFGIGSLWTTGALVLAESILSHRAELHVVLPFSADDYLAFFGQHGAAEAAERRARCLAAATTVTSATTDGDFADPRLIEYAALIAVGLAETRARRLSTEVVTLELTSAAPDKTSNAAGPRASIGNARTFGVAGSRRASVPPALSPGGPEREIRTFLFADVFRFSTIPESRLPGFWSDFMAGLAATIDAAGTAVLYRNTWGDALFLVVSEIEAAADLALQLQERAATLRSAGPSMPELRIGLHHGPVFRGWDPVRNVSSYFGTQVSRAARVEPVAPPGAVFVTEPFAAILATGGSPRFDTEYVGVLPLPKKYGEHRMYRLARRWSEPTR